MPRRSSSRQPGGRCPGPRREGQVQLPSPGRIGDHLPTRIQTRHLLLGAALVVLTAANAACSGPSFIDKECIKGRISSEQANEINKGPWEHLPTYNRDENGKCKHCAQESDRIFSAKCSQFIKDL
jgi:hypothetical protein